MLHLQSKPRSWAQRESLMDAIRNLEEFRTAGSLKAERAYMGEPVTLPHSTGRLPSEYVDNYRKAIYAVYSYATPIAWYDGDTWTVPNTTYSVTTGSQQGIVRQALSQTGYQE